VAAIGPQLRACDRATVDPADQERQRGEISLDDEPLDHTGSHGEGGGVDRTELLQVARPLDLQHVLRCRGW